MTTTHAAAASESALAAAGDFRTRARSIWSVGRMHIVAIGAMGTFTFGGILFGERFFALSALSALDWFLVNLINRVVDVPEDRANGIVGTDFVAAHARGLLRLGLGLLVASLVLTALVSVPLLLLRLAFHTLGFAYNYTLLPGKRRIKTLYFWKNTASAIGFLITVFGFPLAAASARALPFAPGVGRSTVLAAAVFFFLFELSYEALYDLRDREGDAAEGVRTYAVVHGEAAAFKISMALCASSVVVLLCAYAYGVVPWRLAVAAFAVLLHVGFATRMYRARRITSSFCVNLTWMGVLVLLVYQVWPVLGLPGST